jgi:K+-transporting ATPase A subunit
MFLGRFLMIISGPCHCRVACSEEPITLSSAGTLQTTSILFIALLAGVIAIGGGLTFLPAAHARPRGGALCDAGGTSVRL